MVLSAWGPPSEAQSFALWLYVACMAAGALLFLAWSRDPRGVPQYEYAIAAFIPVWSGLAYMAIALGQGSVQVGGEVVHVARYLDWLVTTPLLLLALGLTAMFRSPKKDATLLAALVGADVVMILSGLVADLTRDEALRWVWYGVGCAALLAIFALAWGPLRRTAYAHGADLGDKYTKVAALLTALWVGYPLGWALGPSGVGYLGPDAETWWFVLLPIASKVGFSIYDLRQLRSLEPMGHHAHHRERRSALEPGR